MAIPSYASPYMNNYGNQMVGYQNNMPMNQMYGNQQNIQNTGSLIAVLVQGESGANAYPVASGNTVLLIDFDSNKFWLKSNVNGVPQRLRPFSFSEDIQEHSQHTMQGTDYVSKNEFNNLSQSVLSLSNDVKKLIADLGGASNE